MHNTACRKINSFIPPSFFVFLMTARNSARAKHSNNNNIIRTRRRSTLPDFKIALSTIGPRVARAARIVLESRTFSHTPPIAGARPGNPIVLHPISSSASRSPATKNPRPSDLSSCRQREPLNRTDRWSENDFSCLRRGGRLMFSEPVAGGGRNGRTVEIRTEIVNRVVRIRQKRAVVAVGEADLQASKVRVTVRGRGRRARRPSCSAVAETVRHVLATPLKTYDLMAT